MKKRSVYISPDVLRWRAHLPGGAVLPDTDKRRAYDHLRRAEFFLAQPMVVEDDLADCLGNLRRAVTHRVQLLEKLYRLRVPLQAGAKGHFLELLADVGIVRPSLLRALLEARNSVEYRDRKPPSKKRCHEMSDAVWYFLRSTDPLVLCRRDDCQLAPAEDGYPTEIYWLALRMVYGARFKMETVGWLPASMAVENPRADWLRVDADDFGTRIDRWGSNPAHENKKEGDWWLRGTIAPERRCVASMLTLAFEAE